MILIMVVIVGLALGVLFAQATVPRVALLPTVAVTILSMIAALVVFQQVPASLAAGLLFVASILISGLLVSGLIWTEAIANPVRSYWSAVYLSFRSPSMLRHAYEVAEADRANL